jgi:hypothetical protein
MVIFAFRHSHVGKLPLLGNLGLGPALWHST